MTLRQYIYSIKKELKLNSDDLDAQYSNRWIAFLLHNKRAFLIKQKFTDARKQIPTSLRQEICVPLEKFDLVPDVCDESILKSKQQMPELIDLDGRSSVSVYTSVGGLWLNYVSYERFKYVGYNNRLKNQVYIAVDPNGYLYMKSQNDEYKLIDSIYFSGLFLNPEEAYMLNCTNTNKECDTIDMTYPITGQLADLAMQLISADLLKKISIPNDNVNNAQETPRT